jgi:hypothetical protein
MISKYTLQVKEIEFNVSIECRNVEPSLDDIRLFLFNSQLIYMKKEVVLTVRVDPEIKDIIDSIAQKGDRTVAWVTRSLITEALQARKLLRPKAKSKA